MEDGTNDEEITATATAKSNSHLRLLYEDGNGGGDGSEDGGWLGGALSSILFVPCDGLNCQMQISTMKQNFHYLPDKMLRQMGKQSSLTCCMLPWLIYLPSCFSPSPPCGA